jgi:Uma2 family endonuclease
MNKIIHNLSELDLNATYSYADYLLWWFEQRVELIKGQIFQMSPAPNRKHQILASNLHFVLRTHLHLKESKCHVFFAPFDVRLLDKTKSSKKNEEIYTVVQPDLCVICDETKLDDKGCIGAPDLIVEILSPGNSKKDLKIKYQLYEEAGVKEYWIVFPSEMVLQQFVLNEKGQYELKSSYAEDEKFHAFIFPDLVIDLAEVFKD